MDRHVAVTLGVLGLLVLDWFLFLESNAIDCYPACSRYQRVVGVALVPLAVLFLVLVSTAVLRIVVLRFRRRG